LLVVRLIILLSSFPFVPPCEGSLIQVPTPNLLGSPAALRHAAANIGPRASRLRLVHLTTVPQTFLFLRGQVGYLRERGFEVFAISSAGPELATMAAEGVHCVPIAMARRITPVRDALALFRIWRALRRLRPDIVDAHTPKAGLLGIVGAWLAGVPVRIYHLHGLRYVTAVGVRRRVLRLTERIAASLATRVLSVSHSNASLAVEEGLVPQRKIRVLLGGSINGVDAERFRPPSTQEERGASRAAVRIPRDARVIGFVGRLAREKGVAELAAAWRVLREEMPDLHLLLVGPDEPHDPLPPEVEAELRSDPRVVLAGLDYDTPRLYRAMDVLALPTYREGFPVVPLEGAASALAVVATRVPGCTDAVVDGATGTLVPPRDVRALTDALRSYLRNPLLRQRHGAAARARVLEEFEQRRLWEAIHAEYLNLWAGTSRAGRG
jgi:glycosyltransferase involved in cell wall biosynthesis